MSIDPAELPKLLEERDKSRASRQRAWENLAEIRWVVKDVCGIGATATCPEDHRPRRQSSEGRREESAQGPTGRSGGTRGCCAALQTDKTPLTLREADYAAAVERLNVAIDRADGLVSR
jgi:hypothetical protein